MRRNIGVVYQEFRLIPHISAFDNVALPLRITKLKESLIRKNVEELLEWVGLKDYMLSKPPTLSGGQQQRVAIARALALRPELLLFDEPTSALDPERVNEVLDVMRTLARQGMTMVVVTHEVAFAKEVGDQVLFMDSGRVIEKSTPNVFFSNAKHQRSRKFLNQIENK